ncbi:MAG: S8 family peptidase [Chloroflexota bacterium]
MIRKLIMGLTLLAALSLVWPASSFITVLAAKNAVADEARLLSPPSRIQTFTPLVLTGRQALTQTNTYTFYLPLVFRNACADSFSYNETLRYNLTKINIEAAWQRCSQGQGITIAVIDTGVDLDHPDLQANLVTGKTFVSGTGTADDDQGHGSHVAGIIAAVHNNGGVIGVAPEASLLPVKVLDSAGSGSISDVADGIIWAADNGADVINLSLGSVAGSATLKAAVDYAYNQGVLLVVAGGNCGDAAYYLNGCSYQDQPLYPGAYTNVIAVAATDSSDNQSSFSNQGSYIDIAAPGSTIYSTYPAGSYATMSGTSMATPHLAGLAALVWSQNSDLTSQEVWAQIRNTADDLGASGWDQQFGYGRIDAAAAMGALQTTSTTAADDSLAEISAAAAETQAPYIAGELLLKLRTGFTVNQVLDPVELGTADAKVADTIDQIGVQKLTVTSGQEQTVLAQLRNSMGIEYAELNYVVTIR